MAHKSRGQVSALRTSDACMEDKRRRRNAFKHEVRSGAREQGRPLPTLPISIPSRAAQSIRERAMEDTEAAAPAVVSGAPGAGADDGAEGPAVTKSLKVAAAVDASEESLQALSWALDNVVRCHPDASLVVVHAQHAVDHFVYPIAAHGIAYAPPVAAESMRKAQEENSRRILAPALAMCKERQVDATAAIVEGDAKEAICHAVEQFQAGLLVLGSRGLGKIKRAFLGSVSDYLSHHACCPVLVVKPTKAQAK